MKIKNLYKIVCPAHPAYPNENNIGGRGKSRAIRYCRSYKTFAKTVLSGEVFKENFTDIFQTNFEQVAFSLELHKKKYQNKYKKVFWKKFRYFINRRLPYLTTTKKASFYRFSNSKGELYNTSFYNCPISIYSCKALLSRKSYVKPCKRAKSFLQNKALYTERFAFFGAPFFQKGARQGCEPPSFHSFLPSRESNKNKKFCKIFIRKQKIGQKQRCNVATKQNLSSKALASISLNIKVGDYLSSGDKVGEKIFYKKRSAPVVYCASIKGDPLSFPKGDAREIERKKPTRFCVKKTGCKFSTRIPLNLHSFAKGLQVQSFALQEDLHKLYTCKKPTGARSLQPRFVNNAKPASFAKALSNKNLLGGENKFLICEQENESLKKKARPIILNSSGRVVTISKTQLILQKTQPILFYNSANLHVKRGEWVKEGSPILTLTHQTLITGDIVQGIPRIEQLFEAFTSPPPAFKDKRTVSKFKDVHDTLHSQVRDIFRKHWLKSVLPIAVRKSLEEIQYILVEMIQKVYLSQGVLIADKHIEIIIRQIASKGQILDSGTTGLFLEEILPIRQIENANLTTPGKKCLYVPAVMGLTAAALNSDSFISAASFQETTRVLSRDAVVGKSDFLRGLKEKVVIGDLISAGTGLDIYFIYTTMLAF